MHVNRLLLHIFLKTVIRKTDCSNCRSMYLLSDYLETLSRIFLPRLTPYAELAVDHQHVYQR
jgi:hypothetical protein